MKYKAVFKTKEGKEFKSQESFDSAIEAALHGSQSEIRARQLEIKYVRFEPAIMEDSKSEK